MPDGGHFNQATITAAIKVGNVSTDQLHDSCLRIMRGWYTLPEAKRMPCGGGVCINNNVSTPAHKQLARKISAMSTVLLKNEGGLLPLGVGHGQTPLMKIALIGSDAKTPYTAGSGSGGVPDSNVAVSPIDAFNRVPHAEVTYEPGLSVAAAVKAAAAADVAIVFASAHSGEGRDRTDLLLVRPKGGAGSMEDIIAAVGNAQQKTIVVAAVPGQILTDWRDDVAAILVPFLPGEQYGNAIADIIFGEVAPQAKTPVSFPNIDNEQGMTLDQWPGKNSTEFPGHKEATYSEGQIVGYR